MAISSKICCAAVAAALVLLALAPEASAQAGAGAIAGRVVDSVTGAPLAGVDITLDGTPYTTATDRTGAFRLTGVPTGAYTLLALYLGHADERADVTVTASQTVTVDVKLAPANFSETVQVTGDPIGQGQAQALNQQRTAPNIQNIISADQIGRFPDPNAAEAAQRIPGVSIARDQGEGRYVLIRGTEPRLNSMMIDGERIPAPEGELRQVALDAVPADQLQSIEVSKAVTPDMDADSIGGAVNLITKQAVGRPTLLFSGAGGYNALQRSGDQQSFSGTAGRRIRDGRVGLLVGGSASSLSRGSENFEAEYDDGDLDDLQLRDYQIVRKRYGLNLTGDVRVNDNTSFVVRGLFNEFKDQERGNFVDFNIGSNRIDNLLKNRDQNQHIRSLSGSGQHVLGGATLDYRLAWAESEEHQPDRLDPIFRQSNVQFSPNVSASSIDPDNIQPNPSRNNPLTATLDSWESEIFKTTDRDITASANLRMALRTSGGSATFLKVGGKVKDKRKRRDQQEGVAEPTSRVLFTDLQDTGFRNDRFLNFFPAGYAPFPGISADASRALYNALPDSAKEINRESDAASYDASETVSAGYAMAELYIGDKLLLLPGVRVEATSLDYSGFDVQYDEDGDYLSTTPVSGNDSYAQFLPGFHLRYSIDPSTNIRAAYTRTLARPNYYDLVPYQLVFQEDADIERGNPALRPTTSNNLDLLFERYFQSVGVISTGVFYKRLNDYIFPFRFREVNFGDTYAVTQPQNGDSASLWGMEVAFQNQLRFLPGPLSGLGIYGNYTWTDSSARFPDRDEDSTLPGQSAHLGNFALSYEKYGFSARTSWNFHGKYIDAIGDGADEDVYYDNHTQWDVNVSQKLTRNIRVYADFLNLTNAPLRYYIGTSDRPIQNEFYRWWTMLGVKMNF